MVTGRCYDGVHPSPSPLCTALNARNREERDETTVAGYAVGVGQSAVSAFQREGPEAVSFRAIADRRRLHSAEEGILAAKLHLQMPHDGELRRQTDGQTPRPQPRTVAA